MITRELYQFPNGQTRGATLFGSRAAIIAIERSDDDAKRSGHQKI